MFSFWVIICILCILGGIGLSMLLFGTGVKRSKAFKDIYFSEEDVNDAGIIFTMQGEYCAVIRFENPVQKFCADVTCYYDFLVLMEKILQTLGEGYCVHKQDIFVRRHFDMKAACGSADSGFLSEAYFRFFDGREYVDGHTYLIITQENKRSVFGSSDGSKWRDFLLKIHKVLDQLHDNGAMDAEFLSGSECREYIERYFALNFKDEKVSMNNFRVDGEGIQMGDREIRMLSFLDVDDVGLPTTLRPFTEMVFNSSNLPVDLMTGLSSVPDIDTLVYNQILFLPNQKYELSRLDRKKNRHANFRGAGNKHAAEDIGKVQDVIARENRQLVYAHFNLVVVAGADKDMQKIINHIENVLSRQNIVVSKRAYNQLELFVASFPGNSYRLSADYDRFLTLSDAAVCLMYKERMAKNEVTPLKFYCTDRSGVPIAIDISGKEGKVKHTDNSNFFTLGPSGSGKSYFMNGMVRQFYEQNTDVVIVDTGDSYEMICAKFNGRYISYSKEHPISMNPFKISEKEYYENFGEKKNFLLSLVILLFKGSEEATKIESTIIRRVIEEYYREHFSPFNGFSDQEREELRDELILQAKKDGTLSRFEDEVEEQLANDSRLTDEERERYSHLKEREEKLQRKIDDDASTDGERAAAQKRKEEAHNELMRIADITDEKFSQKIERRIARIEQQRQRLKVKELSFNSFYEFAVQRIPEIVHDEHIDFAINDFAAILKTFYKGGELEQTLNNDMEQSLFDDRFIVFEIDKVKDDPILFPIIVLIIMDVFTQKMRLKSCRKLLVIEEAWKAIATPTMAEYIQYLYKTARKHRAMVGVVTQELRDITSSTIVKDAIINNSGVFMLLDQRKFREKFDEIKQILALTDKECQKIFTINNLDNKTGRSPFKEVFIKRGDTSDVFGIEEPRECYMAYTTEKVEKEALKLYQRQLGCDIEHAIIAFIRDWDASGIRKSLDFANKVLSAGRVLYSVRK